MSSTTNYIIATALQLSAPIPAATRSASLVHFRPHAHVTISDFVLALAHRHKSNLLNPAFKAKLTSDDELAGKAPRTMEGVAGAEEIFMRKGDVLLFVDCCAHGSAPRTEPGERRFSLYRYGPSWGSNRYGYQPSDELLARLTPRRRKMLLPGGVEPLLPTASKL